MNEYTFKSNELKLQKLVKNLEKRQISAFYAPNKDEALRIALNIIPKGSTVSYGGCISMGDIGLKTALDNKDYNLMNRTLCKNSDELRKFYLDSYNADFYVASPNAITEDGIIIEIDGNGNRVSAITFGPKKVLFIIGVNKLCFDIDSALKRARHEAAIPNAIRLDYETPCTKLGECVNCMVPESICCDFLAIRFARDPERFTAIVVNDDLGL